MLKIILLSTFPTRQNWKYLFELIYIFTSLFYSFFLNLYTQAHVWVSKENQEKDAV